MESSFDFDFCLKDSDSTIFQNLYRSQLVLEYFFET